jgi:hypothetical protein
MMLVASLPVATVASCGNPEAIDTSERTGSSQRPDTVSLCDCIRSM